MSEVSEQQACETLGFQAEVKQLLHLMVHSLYSNKEIFLRELVSNASDACDKLRFEAIQHPEWLEQDTELVIAIDYDVGSKTLRISDNGIGMSRDEVIANLGTIARSGTREFFSQLTGDARQDTQLIGQFGVGFYSAFIVAERVTVVTRRAGLEVDQAVRWESTGEGDFTLAAAQREQRGTDIILHLREGEEELLAGHKLREILRKYSDHIAVPIRMFKDEWDGKKGEGYKGETLETVNQANALWARSKAEIDDEQYKAFYKHLTRDFNAPLAWTHNRVEGRNEYTQLLYLPGQAPMALGGRDAKGGVKLYVRRVFIMDDADQLMPAYLRFVRGVIDSSDLPLNVSREILQSSREVKAIREGSTKRVLALLEELAANQPELYAEFWTACGKIFKEGPSEDQANLERIAGLLRFASTHAGTEQQTVALSDYVARMAEGQDKIYYIIADSFAAAINSPHLELLRQKGIEVLLLSDRVDEWMMSHLHEFEGKRLVSVAKGGLDLGELEQKQEDDVQPQAEDDLKTLIEHLQNSLGEQVREVRLTKRLVDSAACVVVSEYEMSSHLQRLLKANGQQPAMTRPILEINPKHRVIERLREAADGTFDDWAQLILDQALLAEGAPLADPAGFVKRMNRLLIDA